MDVLNQVRKLGRDASRRAELREYCQLNNEEILRVLPSRVLSSEGADLLHCLLNGIPDTSPSSIAYKTKVMDIVLERLRSEPTSLSVCCQLVGQLRLELPRAPPADVARRADDCVHSLLHDDDVNMTWRDILPECLSVLSERGRLVHCGTEMSADEYKTQCVRTLCQCRWQERCVVQLAAMFTDMQLDREAHAQVVTKLCTVMLELPPDSVPPLLLQLLKLCKSYHLETVLAYLSRYFNTKLYGRLGPLQDSDSTHMDIEEFGGHTASELTECVYTCVYHMVSTAPEQLLKALKGWPRSRLLRAPLLLEATLALAGVSAFRGACLALARAAILQGCLDERHCLECAWLRDLPTDHVDLTRVLKIIIAESINQQLTMAGVMELAFALLGVTAAAGRERAALRCWRYGELALVRLARAQPATTPHILRRLADRLAGEHPPRQAADCLLTLCKLTPLALERCTQLCSIIENCQASNGDFRSAAAVLDAVHPILQFSTRVRDTLVMVCRKGLFSRDSASRCLALWGFLGLLRHVKLGAGGGNGGDGGDSTRSDQYSVYSCLTQISIDLHSTQLGASVSHVRNEAVCREVVSILRRCFQQDASVKQLLYTHIYSSVKHKVSLHESILEMLHEHLAKYISEKGDIDFEKCVQLTATGANLTEPIGYLLVAVQQFLQQADEPHSEDVLEEEPEAPGYFKRRLSELIDGLCDTYRRYTLADLHMEGEHGLTDATPESRARCMLVQQRLQVCEALAAHRLRRWSPGSERDLPALLALHAQLLQHAKTPSKLTKKGNKAMNDTGKETQKSQKTPRRGADKEEAPVKLSGLARARAAPFKPLPCLWDLGVCCRALELLYSEEVSWSSAEQRAAVRARRDVHQFALGALRAALAAHAPGQRAPLAAACARAAAVLYARCLARFQDMCDFHEPTALASVDAFRECVATVAAPQRRLDTLAFLRQVNYRDPQISTPFMDPPLCSSMVKTASESEGSTADCLAAILRCVLNGLQQLDSEQAAEAEPTEQDAMSRRLVVALVQLASLAIDKLPPDTSESLDTVVVELERLARSARVECAALLPALLSVSARCRSDGRLVDELLLKLRAVLGKTDDEEDSTAVECDLFPFMDESVAQGVHGQVCAHVAAQCALVDRLLQRARELDAAAKHCTHHDAERIEKELTELDKCAVVQLCQLGGRVARLAELRCAVGAGSDRTLQAAVRLYGPLTALVTRLQRSPPSYVHTIRLERALGACGRRLSGALDDLITYVEAAAAGDKVLRDTRLVPRLVFAAENFSKHVIMLANKTKLELQRHLSLGTARDFRISAAVLAEALRAQRPDADDIEEEDDASTVVLSAAAAAPEGMEVDEGEAGEVGADAGEAGAEGARGGKRRRLSAR